MKNVVVVGSLNMDLVSTVGTMPREGETILANSFSMHSGGKGANQAAAVGRLGGCVDMIGALGDDAFAQQLADDLADAGVGTAGIKRVAGSSGCATILVAASGSNCIVVNAGANAQLCPEDLDHAASRIADAAVILCQLETPLDTVEHLGELALRAGSCFVLDPAPAPTAPLSEALMKSVTWLTPNETETATLLALLGQGHCDLSSEDDVQAAADVLLNAGPRNVVIKRGSQGVYIAGKDCTASFIVAPAVTAVDTTAAGDAFNGGFAFALAQGKSPAEAAAFACRVAAYSVTRHGAQEAMPTMDDLNTFLQ